MKRYLAYSLLACVAISSLSCGYTTQSALPEHLKTIHIPPFKNSISLGDEGRRNIYLPLLEVKARNAILNRFLFDGNLKIVDRKEEADLILDGELIGYHRQALRYTDDDDVEEYRVRITTSLTLTDTQEEEPMWREGGFAGEATYFVVGAQATSENAAVLEATEDLARRVVERTVEDW